MSRTAPMRIGLSMAMILAFGCKSQPELKPYEIADEAKAEREDDLLERDVEPRSRSQTSWDGDIEFSVPTPPEKKTKDIDGEFEEWSSGDFKSFGARKNVVDGEHFWDGRSDASVRVAADSDEGHVYFAVSVRDDTVIDAGSVDPFADGVVLWLRDPGLAELRHDLPDGVKKGKSLQPELAILFTPDGQFWRRDEGPGDLYRKGITAATVETSNGYRVEMALKLGVMKQISKLPMPELAFRVELIDGDEPERRGEQTHVSTLPSPEDGEPRFAVLDLGNWLPYASLRGKPPREDALGRWQLDDGAWNFEPFEVASKHWRLMGETDAFEESLRNRRIFSKVCAKATKKAKLVEAFQSRRGHHRAALMLCGTRPTKGQCPADAKAGLFWVHLKAVGEEWTVHRALQVGETMNQCPESPAPGKSYYTTFSFTPLDMIGTPVWALGWHQYKETSGERLHRSGIWILNTRKEQPKIGTVQTFKKVSHPGTRTLSTSRVFLTEVDETRGLDLCEVETIRDQKCRGFDHKCRTPKRGQEVITHIQMWKPAEETFEKYMMSKHRNCSAPFDFTAREAYLLFHRNDRVGIIKSPSGEGGE